MCSICVMCFELFKGNYNNNNNNNNVIYLWCATLQNLSKNVMKSIWCQIFTTKKPSIEYTLERVFVVPAYCVSPCRPLGPILIKLPTEGSTSRSALWECEVISRKPYWENSEINIRQLGKVETWFRCRIWLELLIPFTIELEFHTVFIYVVLNNMIPKKAEIWRKILLDSSSLCGGWFIQLSSLTARSSWVWHMTNLLMPPIISVCGFVSRSDIHFILETYKKAPRFTAFNVWSV